MALCWRSHCNPFSLRWPTAFHVKVRLRSVAFSTPVKLTSVLTWYPSKLWTKRMDMPGAIVAAITNWLFDWETG